MKQSSPLVGENVYSLTAQRTKVKKCLYVHSPNGYYSLNELLLLMRTFCPDSTIAADGIGVNVFLTPSKLFSLCWHKNVSITFDFLNDWREAA